MARLLSVLTGALLLAAFAAFGCARYDDEPNAEKGDAVLRSPMPGVNIVKPGIGPEQTSKKKAKTARQ